ncbi:Txe/YoeB family addiction module toxin [Nostoc commune]|uniref:Txe/YoeB family addiction module toxin n=1 Tax=Nostoc commune TaxID=1178 RepID=UPI002ED7F0BA
MENDQRVTLKVLDIVKETCRDTFKGKGKPEPLKYLDSNTWSRRLTEEHRIVYLVKDDEINFLQARYHY